MLVLKLGYREEEERSPFVPPSHAVNRNSPQPATMTSTSLQEGERETRAFLGRGIRHILWDLKARQNLSLDMEKIRAKEANSWEQRFYPVPRIKVPGITRMGLKALLPQQVFQGWKLSIWKETQI